MFLKPILFVKIKYYYCFVKVAIVMKYDCEEIMNKSIELE